LNKDYITNYFIIENGNYRITDEIKKKVTFKYLNICNAEFPVEFDLISVKNVLIYFNENIIDCLMKKFHNALKTDGILVTTATEFQLDYNELFDIKKKDSIYYYKKWTTCKRCKFKSSKVNLEKRSFTVFKDSPNVSNNMTEEKIITTFKGVISHNIDEMKFKQMFIYPLFFISSKKIIYDFFEVKFINNIHLRYIKELLPVNICRFNKISIIFIVNERFKEDFIHSNINQYVKIVTPSEYKNESIDASPKSESCDKIKKVKVEESQINYPVTTILTKANFNTNSCAFSILEKHNNKNITENKKSILESKNCLTLDKIYETSAHADKFKNQLLQLAGTELTNKKIIIDGSQLEFINELCIIYLKRFIGLCNSSSINIRIIKFKKSLAEYLIRNEISCEYFEKSC